MTIGGWVNTKDKVDCSQPTTSSLMNKKKNDQEMGGKVISLSVHIVSASTKLRYYTDKSNTFGGKRLQ